MKEWSPANIHTLLAVKDGSVDKQIFYKALGMLNQFYVHSRTDIMFTKNISSQFAINPVQTIWSLTKTLLRYLKGKNLIGISLNQMF